MGSEFGSYTEWLIEEIESQAEWRTRKAEEHPEDKQNLEGGASSVSAAPPNRVTQEP